MSSTSIDVRENIPANVQRIMQERIDSCRLSLQQAPPHQAIHEVRKQLKKVRALLRLVRSAIGEHPYREANTYFRDVARLLSDARDVAASLDTATELRPLLGMRRDRHAVEQLRRHLVGRKAAITRYQVHGGSLLTSVQEALADAERFHRSWVITDEGFAALAPGMKRIYRQCQKRQAKAYAHDNPEAFHEWRKSVKYLRYQIDTLSPLWPGPLGALESELHDLTDYLGDDHDLLVLREMIEQTEMMRPATMRSVFRVIDERRETLQRAAQHLAQKLFAPKPKRWVGTLADWWDWEVRWAEGEG